jgi:CRP-like cAMP-binding protein
MSAPTTMLSSSLFLATGSTGPRAMPANDPLNKMMGVRMSFARNRQTYGEGEPADCLYRIISGTVRTSKIFGDSRRQVGAFTSWAMSSA